MFITAQAILNDLKVIEIRRKYTLLIEEEKKKSDAQRKLAKEYGVSRSIVSDAFSYRTWKHVE